ncbi:gliding motility protein GldN [Pedobacter sp. MC2016-14]|uniref:type IX secretion system ring protein PorN/GldN n=1 Tax=Pedobacter sp. MC2016-14 TaxID=2897327 RepID=UPI001E3534F9|nr:gliding motility protein GldN [Pedobacter sp. MC2016-14]MCD0486877.1 gliding motility protein GldN [Pedobacter sp. MC2016-14]
MKNFTSLLIVLLGVISLNATAQVDSVPPGTYATDSIPLVDGYSHSTVYDNAKPFPMPVIKQSNIRFYKRVYRDIDLTDKQNAIFATPGATLIEAIMKDIAAGKLTVYDATDDSFKKKLSAKEGMARFTDSVMVPKFDNEGNQIGGTMTLNEFNPEKITKFRIKEDIFLDKQRGKMETRIVGLAPLMDITSNAELAASVGATPAFWLYYPQVRYTMVKMDISDVERNLFDMSMDDIFLQRKFASKIIREGNNPSTQDSISSQASELKLKKMNDDLWKNPKGVKEKDLVTEADLLKADKKKEKKPKAAKAPKAAKLPKEKAVKKESTPVAPKSTPVTN